jgi:ribonuclease Z
LKLTILGCYAATPRTITNPTAQVLEIKNRMFLIDCGEGTQVQLRKNKIKFSKINHIFISHLHGDHFFGLVGLISTFMLLNRESDLHVYGPKGIKEIILPVIICFFMNCNQKKVLCCLKMKR